MNKGSLIIVLVLSLGACAAPAADRYTPDYRLKAVPPDLTRDDSTTFLIDGASKQASAGYAGGQPALVATGAQWTATGGWQGPLSFEMAGNLDPSAFTVEMIVRLNDRMDNRPFGRWSVSGRYNASLTPSGFTITGQGATGSLTAPFGGNGISLGANGKGRWVYLAFGTDLAAGLAGSAVRSLDGDLLDRNHQYGFKASLNPGTLFTPTPVVVTNSGTVTIGAKELDILKLRISKGFRRDVLEPRPELAVEGALRTFLPREIAADRVSAIRLTRQLGYPGYRNTFPYSITEESIPLKAGDSVTIPLGSLPVGLYSLPLFGTVDPNGRTNLDRVWKPCPMEFEAKDGQGRSIASGKRLLKQSLNPVRLQAFDIQVDTAGPVTAVFRLATNAQETALLQRIGLVDTLAGLPDVAVKRSQNLEPGQTNQLAELTPARIERDQAVWSALPPLNIHLQVHDHEKTFRQPPAGVEPSPWECISSLRQWTGTGTPVVAYSATACRQALAPLDLINLKTGERFSHGQMMSNQTWPGDCGDDGAGLFFPKARFPSLPHDIYYAPRAVLLGQRVKYVLGLLGAGDHAGMSLAAQYAEQGDPNVGHDAALALVRLAYDWPAQEMNCHEHRLCTLSPDFEFNRDYSQSRNGKYFYEGWSGDNTVGLLTAYDQLFPYIRSNAVFAAAVHRFIPWVNTPEDVIRLLDRRLVFASVRDLHLGRIRAAPVEDTAAQVLGPHPLTAPLMDFTRAYMELYPYEGPFQELYACALSRSGVYHIGSFMTYAFGSACSTVNKAWLAGEAKKAGIPLPMDISDIRRYPKIRGASDFMIDLWIAGAFPFMVGDASGGPHSPHEAKRRLTAALPSIEHAFALTGDPRHAWLLEHLGGRTNVAVLAAAKPVADPILHNPSRIVPDYAAILEGNVDSADPEQKTAATLRIGAGVGHAHNDYLDLNLFAMGLPMAVDLACRNEGNNWSRPGAGWSFLHNHALPHVTENPKDASLDGDPRLIAFAPPLVRAECVDSDGRYVRRDTILMQAGPSSNAFYAFDLQRVRGGAFHTWCFHGCESRDLALNVALKPATNRWTDRLLEGTTKMGTAGDTVEAVWTLTRTNGSAAHSFNGGGTINLVAAEQAILGARYKAERPEARLRALLLDCEGDLVMQGSPYSERYQYAFPFLWVQRDEGDEETPFAAVYDWYRGTNLVVEKATLVRKEPLTVNVRLVNGQSDTFTAGPRSFTAVSRDAAGLRWIKLSGADSLDAEGVALKVSPTDYQASVVDINYTNRTLTLDCPLPANPTVAIGNSGRRITLALKGSGTRFTWDDDLLVNQAEVKSLTVKDPETIELTLGQNLFRAGSGNRKAAGFTVATENGAWLFRGGKVILRPSGATLDEQAFTDSNGDGFTHARVYEIGPGDSVSLFADVTAERTDTGWRLRTNASVEGTIGKTIVRVSPGETWQPLPIP